MKVLLIVIACLIVYILITFNKFIKLKNKVNEAFSTMDVYLKKRWDLVPNLVEIVKGYTKHEEETLEKITKLRSLSYGSLSNEQKIDSNEKIRGNIETIMLLAENYPELKANDNYKKLGEQLIATENDISNARKYYNAIVREFNNKVEMFPSNILAKILNYKTYRMYEADLDEKENIKIKVTKEKE